MCGKYDHVLLGGDMNAHTKDLADYLVADDFLADHFDFDPNLIDFFDKTNTLINLNIPLDRSTQDVKVNGHGGKLLDICKNNNIFICNGRIGNDKNIGKSTFKDNSVIDYIISTPDLIKYIEEFDIIELDSLYSDGHSLLSMNINISIPNPHDKISEPKSVSHKWDETKSHIFLQNLDISVVNDTLQLLDNEVLDEQDTIINQATYNFSCLFSKAADAAFAKRSISKITNNKPFFGPECTKWRNEYNRVRKKYNRNKTQQNKVNLNNASKHYKQTLNKFIRKHKMQSENKLRQMHAKKPKDYWKVLNSLKKQKNTVSPSASDFLDYYKDLCSTDIRDNDDDNDINFSLDANNSDILNSPITCTEIDKMISKAHNMKAAGLDNILNEMLKCSKEHIMPILVKLFNKVLDTGVLPELATRGL